VVDQQTSSEFRPQAYLKPRTEKELAEILGSQQTKARIIGGGTGIYELSGRGLLSEVDTLVDISGLGWAYVRGRGSSIRIGSATTMTDLLLSDALKTRACGAVVDALRAIQPLQVKNVATVGGAICMGLPFFDLPTALIAVDAVVHVGPTDRLVKLHDFLRGYFSIDLAPHEFVRKVEVPLGTDSRSSAFQKFALTSDDWATINCGVSLALGRGRRIKDSRLVFGGGVGERPVRASLTEKALEGVAARGGDVKAILKKQLPLELETTADSRASSEYRLELAKVLGRRTIMLASERMG